MVNNRKFQPKSFLIFWVLCTAFYCMTNPISFCIIGAGRTWTGKGRKNVNGVHSMGQICRIFCFEGYSDMVSHMCIRNLKCFYQQGHGMRV